MSPALKSGRRIENLTIVYHTETAIRLPGINIPVGGMIDEENHELRYVLKDIKTGHTYLVICFTLVKQDQQAEDGEQEQQAEK